MRATLSTSSEGSFKPGLICPSSIPRLKKKRGVAYEQTNKFSEKAKLVSADPDRWVTPLLSQDSAAADFSADSCAASQAVFPTSGSYEPPLKLQQAIVNPIYQSSLA
ncbi:unnamed protein product [Diplocarpon coronariae]|nr:hypothetical protein JHW43_007211 [Diplocarpon mali]